MTSKEIKELSKSSQEKELNDLTADMVKAGLHFGSATSKINPKMKPFLYGVRNGVHIIDLEKTAKMLEQALDFIKNLVFERKVILLVGTSVQFKELVKKTALECNLPYINKRWLGGTLTNFGIIRKRIQYFIDLEEKKKSGELEKYTKKERAQFDKELADLEIKFGGIRNLSRLPDAVFVVNTKADDLAIKEANQKEIKTIAIVDTDADPSVIDYPIPANDDAISSVKYVLDKIKEVILKTKPKEIEEKTEDKDTSAKEKKDK